VAQMDFASIGSRLSKKYMAGELKDQ
jgi:hypothetical protein